MSEPVSEGVPPSSPTGSQRINRTLHGSTSSSPAARIGGGRPRWAKRHLSINPARLLSWYRSREQDRRSSSSSSSLSASERDDMSSRQGLHILSLAPRSPNVFLTSISIEVNWTRTIRGDARRNRGAADRFCAVMFIGALKVGLQSRYFSAGKPPLRWINLAQFKISGNND